MFISKMIKYLNISRIFGFCTANLCRLTKASGKETGIEVFENTFVLPKILLVQVDRMWIKMNQGWGKLQILEHKFHSNKVLL